MNNFNKRLKEERLKRDLSQKEFAKIIGVSNATIGNMERGQNPSEETIHKAANALQWTDGDYADYTLGISKQMADLVIRQVENNMRRLGIPQTKMIHALGISIDTYRNWRKEMTPLAKRELLKFARMDKEAFDEAVKEHTEAYNKMYGEDPLEVDKFPLSGDQLKELRTKKKMTQFKIAQKIGMDAGIISKWELGKRPIPKARRRALYKIFDIPYDEGGRSYKTDMQREEERKERAAILHRLDRKTDNWHTLPDDDEDLVKLRELVGVK